MMAVSTRHCLSRMLALGLIAGLPGAAAAQANEDLANRAQAVLKANCHRCHGQNGSVEGGLNYILDRDKLVARKKIVPGRADQSPLFLRVAGDKMPPPDEKPRPSKADTAILRQWIDAGAPGESTTTARRQSLSERDVLALILADLEALDKRSRRFTRYFSLAHLYNAGLGDDELQTYRNALSKLANSLSWHPRITVPKAIDRQGTLLRIDLRDFQWDANLWNRILAEYPYGILHDTAVARACAVAAATRMPVLRADWFIATACRPPLYHDILQLPANLAELERQLRVDAAVNIQQERVARAGFNGSGVAKNNRLLERHDAVHGAYWRTYDFDAVPQNLVERDTLLPDRRNLFAFPLGPGALGSNFQHAGGEAIWNLPNGLQGYMLVNANGIRVDRGPTAIVSDPKRPDRAVETGISCMSCHYRGINPKDDQIRAFAQKNAKAFSRADYELIQALYAPVEKMRQLMDEDAERFRQAVEKTGSRISAAEPISTITLRYEADVDLPTAAAEAGITADDLAARLGRTDQVALNLGALKSPGGIVARQVFIQAFGDLVREFHLGLPFQPGLIAQSLPDNTGELDPLEAISSRANSMAFSPDGRRALFASADKTLRLWDVETGREIRPFIGHGASVWSVAFSPDGRSALSGSADRTVRLWDVEKGQELARLTGHTELVTTVAFSPDGRRALSGSYDHTVILWDLERRAALRTLEGQARYINAVAFAPDGRRALVCGEKVIYLFDLETGKQTAFMEGHMDSVTSAVFSPDGRRILSGGDDGRLRLWDVAVGELVRTFKGETGPVKSVALSPDGKQALSGSADNLVRLWDVESGQELRRFAQHGESAISVRFIAGGKQTLSGSRDSAIRVWNLARTGTPSPDPSTNNPPPVQVTPPAVELKPRAVIPVEGTVGSLLLSPNGKWLYYLAEGKLGRIDTAKRSKDRELVLAPGTDTLFLTRDGKMLYATTPGSGRAPDGSLQVIDPLKMTRVKTIAVATPYDLAATDSGLVFLSGGSGDWTAITAMDVKSEAIVARWGGVWTRSILRLSPDQDRLYFATQGVTPGQIEALVIPRPLDQKSVQYKSPAAPEHALGGDFLIAPDGKHLLCKTGTMLRLSSNKDEDLKHAVTLEPFLAAAVAPELGIAVLTTKDSALKVYSYPEFKLQVVYRLSGVAYQAAIDAKQGRLYVAVFDPRSLTERPRGRGHGEVHAYELKELLRERP